MQPRHYVLLDDSAITGWCVDSEMSFLCVSEHVASPVPCGHETPDPNSVVMLDCKLLPCYDEALKFLPVRDDQLV